MTGAVAPYEYQSGDVRPGACVHAIQGRRGSMEDETFYASWYCGQDNPTVPARHKKVTVEGVLDGHGGAQASQFVKKWLPWVLAHYVVPSASVATIKRQIVECFLRMQNFMRHYSDQKRGLFDHQGTTVSMLLWTEQFLFCANAGDSRCVWCGTGRHKAQPLSRDHKPSDPEEKRRVEALGGRVSRGAGDVARVEPAGLATSRSLGDLDSRRRSDGRELPRGTYLVSPVPDVTVVPRRFLGPSDLGILACDGLWDVMSNGLACRLARQAGIPDACRVLVREAYRAGSGDNISVMVVPFGPEPELSEDGLYVAAVINPLTGRPIKFLGPTHRRLLEAL